MKTKLTFLSLLFSFFILGSLQAQNLVPNPSFENAIGPLPCSFSPNFSTTLESWTNVTGGSPDIFSTLVSQSCFGHCLSTDAGAVGVQLPNTGEVHANIVTYGAGCNFEPNYRDYLQVQLIEPLVIGETYYAEFYVSHCEYSIDASNNIGLYFSVDAISSNACTNFNFTPQINETNVITEGEEWVLISGTFEATTAAQYMTVGNFFSNADTEIISNENMPNINGRYFIDDFYVGLDQECVSTAVSAEVCMGETLTLFGSEDEENSWATIDAPDVIISTEDSLVVETSEMTGYILYAGCDTVTTTIDVLTVNTSVTELENSLSANAVDAEFQWVDCNDEMSEIDGATESIFTPEVTGSYAVSVTQNGCASMSECFDFIVVSTSDLDQWQRPLIYPNPTNSSAFISSEFSGIMNISIYDGTGSLVFETRISQQGELGLSDLAPGLYVVVVQSEFGVWKERLVKL